MPVNGICLHLRNVKLSTIQHQHISYHRARHTTATRTMHTTIMCMLQISSSTVTNVIVKRICGRRYPMRATWGNRSLSLSLYLAVWQTCGGYLFLYINTLTQTHTQNLWLCMLNNFKFLSIFSVGGCHGVEANLSVHQHFLACNVHHKTFSIIAFHLVSASKWVEE